MRSQPSTRATAPFVLGGLMLACVAAAAWLQHEAGRDVADVMRRTVALQAVLTPRDLHALRAPFTPKLSERYYVALSLPGNADPDVQGLWRRAEATIGRFDATIVPIDLAWSVVDGTKVIARGSGRHRPIGASGGLGAPALWFGDFAARAGVPYELEVSSELGLVAGTTIEIGVASAASTEGLAMGRAFLQAFARPAQLVLLAAAAIFGVAAVWQVRSRSTA